MLAVSLETARTLPSLLRGGMAGGGSREAATRGFFLEESRPRGRDSSLRFFDGLGRCFLGRGSPGDYALNCLLQGSCHLGVVGHPGAGFCRL